MSVTNYNYTGTANYTAPASNTSATSNTAATRANAATTKKKSNDTLDANDFLRLFIKQLQNQDATNPMDSGEMMNQITQLSNMQMMQNMANYSEANYAVSLVGKYVKAMVPDENGNAEPITGTIDRVTQSDGEYIYYIGEKKFTGNDIKEITTPPVKTPAPTTTT